jgi:hypothetical protein
MWRYQATPTEFGTCTWACHRGCGDYTYWRVLTADLGRVPTHDAPEGWGMRDRWLEQLREHRAIHRRPDVVRDVRGCVIS